MNLATHFFRHWMLSSVVLISVVVMAENLRGDEPFPTAESIAAALSENLLDIDGRPQKLERCLGTAGTVLVFLSTECPISNGYVPVLNRLHQQYAAQEVAFAGVNSNGSQSLADMAAHAQKFDVKFTVLKDADAKVAERLGVDVCPMVIVLDSLRKPVYQGRIDDRYARRGGGARDVGRADLEIALHEMRLGQEISVDRTPPVGCPLLKKNIETSHDSNPSATVTYSEQISRLLQKHCQECHRPGGVGPFSLTTYDAAVSWADDIRQFTADRTMPPWLPKSGHDRFVNPRVMTAEEIAQFAAWVAAGAPEGDRSLLPEPKSFSDGWQLGEPDIVLTMSEPYTLGAEGKDEYRCFVLPTHYPQDLYVKAMEVLPGNRAVVHHVIAFLDSSGRSAELDAEDPLPGYTTSAGFPGFLPSGGLGGWAPGNNPDFLPTGIAKALPRNASVVVQVHYHRSGKAETDQTRLGLYLAKEPINRLTHVVPVMPRGGPLSGMTIPSGAKDYEVTGKFVLQRDVLALGVTPHMHLLGQDMKLTATLPDGASQTLIDTRWNFNWQESYQFREVVPLPVGTELRVVAHYDNSADNPYNPSDPPRTVKWGEQTRDEMCIAFLEVAPQKPAASPGDLKPLNPREELRDALFSRLKIEFQKRRLPPPPRMLPRD